MPVSFFRASFPLLTDFLKMYFKPVKIYLQPQQTRPYKRHPLLSFYSIYLTQFDFARRECSLNNFYLSKFLNFICYFKNDFRHFYKCSMMFERHLYSLFKEGKFFYMSVCISVAKYKVKEFSPQNYLSEKRKHLLYI